MTWEGQSIQLGTASMVSAFIWSLPSYVAGAKLVRKGDVLVLQPGIET